MAAGAVALLSYANDLEKPKSHYQAAQRMLSVVFEYSLAIVALGILVPLIRVHRGKKEALDLSMLKSYGVLLFFNLIGMSIGFSLILLAKFGSATCAVYTAGFALILIMGAVIGIFE